VLLPLANERSLATTRKLFALTAQFKRPHVWAGPEGRGPGVVVLTAECGLLVRHAGAFPAPAFGARLALTSRPGARNFFSVLCFIANLVSPTQLSPNLAPRK
jgi:hypothetical protein